jgi:hypothetical protein
MRWSSIACLALIAWASRVAAQQKDPQKPPAEAAPAPPVAEDPSAPGADQAPKQPAPPNDDESSKKQGPEGATPSPEQGVPPPEQAPSPGQVAPAPEPEPSPAPAPFPEQPSDAAAAPVTPLPVDPAAGPDAGADVAKDLDRDSVAFRHPERSFAIEGLAGFSARLDRGPDGFRNHEPFDLSFGLGAWYGPSRNYAIGLEYQRSGLGGARTDPFGASVSVEYDLNTIWAAARIYPWRFEHSRIFAGLGVGISWQEIDANGVRLLDQPFAPAQSFACSETAGPGFSLGPEAGLDFELNRHIAFALVGEAGVHQLTGDFVGSCARGSGFVANFATRLGFLYRWDAASVVGAQSARRDKQRTRTTW